MASSTIHGAAMTTLKIKGRKLKGNCRSKEGSFYSSETGLGGGCVADTPLTLHSEMMTIQSAVSLSSSLGCTSARYV